MEKVIYKVFSIFILLMLIFYESNYVFGAVTYKEPQCTWNEQLEQAFYDLAFEKEYDPKKIEDMAKKIHDKAFEIIKKYSKTKLNSLLKELETSDKTNFNKGGWTNGDTVLDIANENLIGSVEKLISGEYDKDTDASETEGETLDDYKKDKKDDLQDEIDGDDDTVGIFPERKLGLLTDQKEETVQETSPDTIIDSADKFLTVGQEDEIDETSLKNVSNTVYNVLLGVAIALAVIIGLVLGIKFMSSGAEGQAKIKEALIPYIAGCTVAFSSFGIWKLIMIILNNV